MQNLERHGSDNYGGLTRIRLIFLDEIESIPENNGVSLALGLNLKAGASIADMYFTPYTANFSEDEGESEHGTLFKWKLDCLVPKDRLDVATWLKAQRNRDLVAITRDTNGTQRLVGSKDYPIRLKTQLDTGNQPSKKNGFAFQFTGQCPNPALYYLMYEVAPDPKKKFSNAFSFGFLRS